MKKILFDFFLLTHILVTIFQITSATRVTICQHQSKEIRCGIDQFIEITRAMYGSPSDACGKIRIRCYGSNVLNQVQSKCGQQSQTCQLQVPDYGLSSLCIRDEFLQVDYVCKVNICDDESKLITCGSDQYIEVTRARHGRLSKACGGIYGLKCSGSNVLNQVQNTCGQQSQTCYLEEDDFDSNCFWGAFLQVDYECRDKPNAIKTLRVCDRYSSFFGCPQGKVINIISAFYGRKSASFCPFGDISNTKCAADVLRHIRFNAQGKGFAGVSASSAYFGDPCPGISKYLEIKYDCQDPATLTTSIPTTTQPQLTTTKSPFITKRICDRYSTFFGCPQGKLINVASAFYGRKSAAYCTTGDISNTNCAADVLRHIRFNAQGKGFAGVSASSAYFGDPCPGISKYLELKYDCKDPAFFSTSKPATTKLPTTKEATTPVMPPIPPDSCGMSQVAKSRIIGGQRAIRGAWPWQISLYRNDQFQCGGSLINPDWIVTATHCVEDINNGYLMSDYHVILGDYDRSVNEGSEERRQLQKIILHPAYNQDHKYNNDIAMLKLDQPVLSTMYISPICLPTQGQTVPVGTTCIISGWGMTTYPSNPSNILQQGSLPVVSKQECSRRLQTSLGNVGLSISDQMLCAGHSNNATDKDMTTCRGDSGGPFMCQEGNGKWTLQGVTSWGSIRCAGSDRYSVYARVSEFRNWIDDTIKYDGLPPTPPQLATSQQPTPAPPAPPIPQQ